MQLLLKKQSDWQSLYKQCYFAYKNSVQSPCQQQKLKHVGHMKSCCLSSDFRDACKSHSKSIKVKLGLDRMFFLGRLKIHSCAGVTDQIIKVRNWLLLCTCWAGLWILEPQRQLSQDLPVILRETSQMNFTVKQQWTQTGGEFVDLQISIKVYGAVRSAWWAEFKGRGSQGFVLIWKVCNKP